MEEREAKVDLAPLHRSLSQRHTVVPPALVHPAPVTPGTQPNRVVALPTLDREHIGCAIILGHFISVHFDVSTFLVGDVHPVQHLRPAETATIAPIKATKKNAFILSTCVTCAACAACAGKQSNNHEKDSFFSLAE